MTFRELLEQRAKDNGDQPFVFFNDEILTFENLELNVNKTANMLNTLGINKGDHVCMLLPNCLEFIYLWFGLAKIGGVMVPLNPSLRGDGLKYIINHSDSRLIFVHSNIFDPFAFVQGDLEHIETVVGVGQGNPAAPDAPLFNELLDEAPQKAPPVLEIDPSDPLGIIYTSGTTGPPKGAMISHFNYMNSAKGQPDRVFGINIALRLLH